MEPDLQEILSAWMGNELEPERYDYLLDRIRSDFDFRQAFVEEIRILGMLKAVQSSEPRWLRLEDELGWNAKQPADCRAIEDAVAHHVRSHPPKPRRWSRLRIAALVTAASLALIAVGWWFTTSTRRPGFPQDVARNGKPSVPPAPRVPPRALGDGIAMVLQLDGVPDPTPGPPLETGQILKPGQVRVPSGRLTLSMLNGVMVVVEGPADLDLISVDEIYCRQGKLRTRVPEGAEGFVVSGPGTAVVDLGTEFAVNHSPEGRARGRVYQGMVEATVLSPTGTPQRSQLLAESKSFEINPGAGQIDKLDGPERFAAPSNLNAAPLVLDPAYRRAVLDSKPWGYWRFEHRDGERFPNEVSDSPPLIAHGPVRLTPDAGGNRSVEFVAGNTDQYLALPVSWSPTDQPGYAVELWFLTTAIAHASLANLVTPADSNKHSFLLELTSRNRLTLHKPASIRFVHRLPPGFAGGDYTFSDQYYIPYRWHHLVGQLNGNNMEVFVDGNPTPPLAVAADQTTPAGQFLLGRLTTRPKHDPGWSRPFCGRMDEVALYDHPLSLEEVRRHYQLAAPRAVAPN